MGRHADEKRGRGLAGWLVGAVIAVLVVVLAVVGYIVVLHRADSADQSVCSTHVTIAVAAGPNAAPALSDAAIAYNRSNPVVRSACVTAEVTAVSDQAVLEGLTGHWPAGRSPAPGLWVPDNAAFLSALDSTRPDLAAGHPTDPVAWSPVVLAMRADDAAGAGPLSWADLASAAGPTGTVALPGGRHLILALPPIASSPASSYALQSVIAGADPTASVDTATIAAKTAVIKAIDAAHRGSAATTNGALGTLVRSSGHSASAETVTAVPVVEADLVRFDRGSADGMLTAVHPTGSTVGDALIAAPISATWTGRTITAAASDFQAFLSTVTGQQILADHGWRTTSAHSAEPLAAVDTQARVTIVPAGGPDIDHALAVALGQASGSIATTTAPATGTTHTTAPVTGTTTAPPTTKPTTTAPPTTTTSAAGSRGPVVTLIVDTSTGMATKHDGTTLLDWVKKALPSLVDSGITNRIGLWVYADGAIYPPSGFPELVSTGPLDQTVTVTPPGAAGTPVKEPRAKALTDALKAVEPHGDRWAYGAVMEALPKAAKAAVAGRPSRVILVTSGIDQTPGTLRRQVLASVQAGHGSAQLDVVGLGDAVPVDAYSDIAKAGGGEYLPATDPAQLGRQLADFLTLGD